MLEVINASKTFGKGTPNEHKALDHLNLSLKEGKFVTIFSAPMVPVNHYLMPSVVISFWMKAV